MDGAQISYRELEGPGEVVQPFGVAPLEDEALDLVGRDLRGQGELQACFLALGHGQTISQPYVVALICQALALQGDELVLDVGTGSGYQAAVLDELAAAVVSVERIPELAEVARRNLDATGHATVEVILGDGSLGVSTRAPFAAIAVAAAAAELPRALLDQLGPGGRLVLPLGGTLVRVTQPAGEPRVESLASVRFVPLVTGFRG